MCSVFIVAVTPRPKQSGSPAVLLLRRNTAVSRSSPNSWQSEAMRRATSRGEGWDLSRHPCARLLGLGDALFVGFHF